MTTDLTLYDARGASHDHQRHFTGRLAEAYATEITTFTQWERTTEVLSPTVRGTLVTGEAVQVAKFGEDILSKLFAKEPA